jgi:hypothetical protein
MGLQVGFYRKSQFLSKQTMSSTTKKCVLGLNTKVKLIEANDIQKFSVKAITKYFNIVKTEIYKTLKRKSSNVLVQVVQENCELEIKTIMKLW